MKAALRSIRSPDVWDLTTWVPADAEDVAVFLQLFVGPDGEEGEESFDVMVCTPRGLARQFDRVGTPMIGRHYVLIQRWNWAEVSAFFRSAVEADEATDWDHLAGRLGRIGRWEYEDCKEYVPTYVEAPPCPSCGYPDVGVAADDYDSQVTPVPPLDWCWSCGLPRRGGLPEQDPLAWRREWIRCGMPWSAIDLPRPCDWDPRDDLNRLQEREKPGS